MNFGKSAYLKVCELEKKLANMGEFSQQSQGFVEFDKNNLNVSINDESTTVIDFPTFSCVKSQEICFQIKCKINVTTGGALNASITVNNSKIYTETKQVSAGENEIILFKTFTPITSGTTSMTLSFDSSTTSFSASIDDIKVIIIGINAETVNTDIEMRAIKVASNKILISYIDTQKLYYYVADTSESAISHDSFTCLNSAISHCFTTSSLTLQNTYDQNKIVLCRVDSDGKLYVSKCFAGETETLLDTSVTDVFACACPSSLDDNILITYIKNGEIYYTSIKNDSILTPKKVNISQQSQFVSVFAVTQASSDFVYIIATSKNGSNYVIKSVNSQELCDEVETISADLTAVVTKYVDVAIVNNSHETLQVSASASISTKPIYNTLIEDQSVSTIQANLTALSETYEIQTPHAVIYGVKLDRTLNNNAPLGASWATYTDDAVGFSGAYMDFANNTFVDNGWLNRFPFNQIKPCLFKNGAVVGYLNPNDYTKFADGTSAPTSDTTAGDVMVEIPKIYYKISADDQYNYIQISDETFDGACCLAHVYKGQELSKVYVDAYLTPGNDLATIGPRSIKGITVAPSGWACGYQRIYDGMKNFRGSRCEPFTFNIFTLLGCLSAILFKSTNVRTSLGVGLSSQSGGMVTGDLDANGMYFGTNTEGRTKLFGFEDYYGTKFTYCAGFWIEYNTGNLKIIDPYSTVQNYNYDENDPNSLWSYATYTPPEIWMKPTAGTSTYVPVRLAGINKLGFTRVQETGTNISQSNDVGFCSKTRFRNTNRYILGCISSYFGDGGGVYNYDAYNFADTTRRAFRCVYFPEQ